MPLRPTLVAALAISTLATSTASAEPRHYSPDGYSSYGRQLPLADPVPPATRDGGTSPEAIAVALAGGLFVGGAAGIAGGRRTRPAT